MCELEFIAIDGAGSSLCGYLLAKFIIFCVFAFFDVAYLVCATEPDLIIAAQLFVMAVAFELIAVLIGLFYLVFAIVIFVDVFCSVFIVCCCCCVFPLVNHAARRRRIYLDMQREFAASWLVGLACAELYFIFFTSRRVAVEDLMPTVGQNPRRLVVVLDAARQLTGTARCVMNIV